MIEKYNAMLREIHGQNITVQIKSCIEDGNEYYYYTSRKYGDSDTYKTIEEAFKETDIYLKGVGELW